MVASPVQNLPRRVKAMERFLQVTAGPQVASDSLNADSVTGRVRQLIQLLGLQPHPEGGWYREVFRSSANVLPSDGRDSRPALTSIYFLLEGGSFSRWHRVRSDEVWVHLEGAPLLLWTASMSPRTAPSQARLGPIDLQGTQPLHVVPAGMWQAAEPLLLDSGVEHVLVACMVGPGFDFSDFSLMAEGGDEADYVREQCPELARYV
jgi:predicted cupin superfamily sugar epimerase